jgi:hypothetical protein
MLNLTRQTAKATGRRDPRDERRADTRHGPLVRMLQCDLANLDNLTRALSGRKGNGEDCDK